MNKLPEQAKQLSQSQLHTHEQYMTLALAQASLAEDKQEVPVGAIVVLNNEVIGRGHNQTISLCDPSAHAEVMAIKDAAQHIKNYRLIDAILYVTLEPCAMCAGLLVHSRIKTIVYGAHDYKAGAAGSVLNITAHDQLNHKIGLVSGVLEDECSGRLSAFFQKRRALKKAMKAFKNT